MRELEAAASEGASDSLARLLHACAGKSGDIKARKSVSDAAFDHDALAGVALVDVTEDSDVAWHVLSPFFVSEDIYEKSAGNISGFPEKHTKKTILFFRFSLFSCL